MNTTIDPSNHVLSNTISSGEGEIVKPLEQAVKCPRCNSANTKFCYYNNYSLKQPRHFCKTCRRYWTKGGVLRNVPIGSGCRKNKKPRSTIDVQFSGLSPSMDIVQFSRAHQSTGFYNQFSNFDLMGFNCPFVSANQEMGQDSQWSP